MTLTQIPPKITPELKRAVELCLTAEMYYTMVAPIVLGYDMTILHCCEFHVADKWIERGRFEDGDTRVLDPKHAYLMDDFTVSRYFALVSSMQDDHGFQENTADGTCPMLVAESQWTDAKRLVVNEAKYITGFEWKDLWKLEHYTEVPKMVIGLVLSLCPDINGKDSLDRVLGISE